MNKKQTQAALYKMGFDNAFRSYATAVKGFQFGWALGPALAVDGIAGPKTQAAVKKSLARLAVGKSTMSPHFSYVEFRCKCGGKQSGCKRNWTSHKHVRRLEKYRARVARPVAVISGYRCPGHNRAVGGASSSQHLYGYSSDVSALISARTVASWRMFGGIGKGKASGRAVHVDSRDLSPHNTTRSSPARPATWTYSWG